MKFIKYESIYEAGSFFHAVPSPLKKEIEGVVFIEVTPDFKRVQYIREDSLKTIATVNMEV